MRDGVVDELGRCQELGPIMGVVGTKDPKIGETTNYSLRALEFK
jgi:hypothetical protein